MRGRLSPEEDLWITVPNPPRSNVMYRMGKQRMYMPAKFKAFKDSVLAQCAEQRMKPLEGDVEVSMVWYRARKSGDIDGRIKIVLDSLQSARSKYGAYINDSQVRKLTIERRDTEPRRSRMVINVKPWRDE